MSDKYAKPILYLEVMGGLVSRLRAVLAADLYTRRKGMKLRINWPRRQDNLVEWDGEFQAKLEDLWRVPWETCDHPIMHFSGSERYKKDPDEQVRTCHPSDFGILDHEIREPFGRLVPTLAVRKAADIPMPDGTVGLHIRSHLPHPDFKPLSWFVEVMKTYTSSQMFYLVCDEQSTEDKLREEFPRRILTRSKDYAYDLGGITKAAADLYVLSDLDKTKMVHGSVRSSYSQLVAILRGAKIDGPLHGPGNIRGGRYSDAWNKY